ncbi:uncharacterized protein LOC134846579 [Symsagittifera roscoffensis]|uniref:uncharacterized protein LOC134846579 n=1 Tax=Symsagittifera roscoffensis TaxID=84072 RepID=UPI00307C7676
MEETANLKKQFHEELDTLKIRWPGGDEISFGDDQNLREMLRCQYPDWKTKGKVTSVPTARVPAMFLSPEMVSEKLKNHYERIQKGDEGELKVYKKILDGFGPDHDGIIILPNLDNNQLFKSKIGCVEIDMIILHPTKGVFVVSVKNKDLGGQDEIKEKEKLQTDLIKHTDFVWHLSSYRDIDQPCSSSSAMPFIPIHAVFFHLRADSVNIQDLETNQAWYSYKKLGNVIVFQQPQFDIFQKNWCQKMSKIPDVQLGEPFETLVSRLVAISSMEGAVALIHNKIVSNDLQSMQIKKKDADEWTEKQLDDVRDKLPKTTKEHLKKCMQSSYVPTKRGKTKVILWTKEQLEIIVEVFDALANKKKKPMRLLVEGPKGSGKTMLLVYLAKLAKTVLGDKEDDRVSGKDCKDFAHLHFEYEGRLSDNSAELYDMSEWKLSKQYYQFSESLDQLKVLRLDLSKVCTNQSKIEKACKAVCDIITPYWVNGSKTGELLPVFVDYETEGLPRFDLLYCQPDHVKLLLENMVDTYKHFSVGGAVEQQNVFREEFFRKRFETAKNSDTLSSCVKEAALSLYVILKFPTTNGDCYKHFIATVSEVIKRANERKQVFESFSEDKVLSDLVLYDIGYKLLELKEATKQK